MGTQRKRLDKEKWRLTKRPAIHVCGTGLFCYTSSIFFISFFDNLEQNGIWEQKGKGWTRKRSDRQKFRLRARTGVTRSRKTAATYLATNRRFVNVVVLTLAYMGCDAWVVFVERRLGTNYVGMGGSKIEGGGGGRSLGRESP